MTEPGPPAAVPPRMRAAVQHVYGPPEVIRPATVDTPRPRSGELLVAVHVAGAETATLHLSTGTPALVRIATGLRRPRTSIPGLALAGAVAGHGDGVDAAAWPPGTRVAGFGSGAYAEYTTVKASALARIPADVSDAEAATLPISASTALQALRAAGLDPNSGTAAPAARVLVIGLGAVGTVAVQLARIVGATVDVIAGPAKQQLASELGAELFLDRHRVDLGVKTGRGRPSARTRPTRQTEDPGSWDVIIDTAGNRPLRALRRVLSPAGTLVIVGGDAGGPLLGGLERTLAAAALSPLSRQRLIGLVARENPADLTTLLELIAERRLTPVVDSVHPLEEVATALRRVLDGRALGKVLVAVPG